MKRSLCHLAIVIVSVVGIAGNIAGCDALSHALRLHTHDEEEAGHDHDSAHSHEADHGHEHGAEHEKTAQITVWGERFELFIEHPYLVANSPATFITHVTDLVTLHPRREGPVTFMMEAPAGERHEHTAPAPARPGIYLPEISFPAPGSWKLSLRIPLEGQDHVVGLPPVEVYASDHDAAHAPEQETPEGISFLKEQQWKILSKTETVRRRPLSEEIRLTGVVRPSPGKRAVVSPPVEGRLMRAAEGVLPFIGDSVEAGQPLAVLMPVAASPLQSLALELAVKSAESEGKIREAEAALERAVQALNRTRELFEKKAKSAREVEEAEFAKRQAEAELAAARSLRQSYADAENDLHTKQTAPSSDTGAPSLILKAPISGCIAAVEAVEGEFVRPERALFTILDISSVLIEARVPESALLQIRPDLRASYAVPGEPDGLRPIVDGGGGRFVVLGGEIDVATRTAPLLYETPNPDGRLRIGLALTVFVETGRSEDAIVIPLSAIVEEEGHSVAYVQLSGETFERRDLTLGIRGGEYVQVLAGIDEGEHVVTKGAYAVRLASVSSAIPAHGHVH